MSSRSRILSFGTACVLVAAGVLAATMFTSTLGQVLGVALSGIGLVLATAFVFLEVGLSEDRARAKEAAEKRRSKRRLPARGRPRLERMRGRPRRLR